MRTSLMALSVLLLTSVLRMFALDSQAGEPVAPGVQSGVLPEAPLPEALPGAEIYRSACAACHGADGKGASRDVVGFATPLPDFTRCSLTTPETGVDWQAVTHRGGRARALSPRMPAFGEALSDAEIDRVLAFVRTFCRSRAWPPGDLNLPRPFMTAKAFPENDALVAASLPMTDPDFVDHRFIYERRIGPRLQYEVVVPFNLRETGTGWHRGLGDVTVGGKYAIGVSREHGSIFSAGGDVTFPTGKEAEGLGRRLTIFDPSVAYGQILGGASFLQAQAGVEMPLNIATANNEAYWRVTVGKTFTSGRWGRAWSPMFEVLGGRELAPDEPTAWQVLPQMEVTVSRRQHVAVNGGVLIPVNAPGGRRKTLMLSLLWDWAESGLFSGW